MMTVSVSAAGAATALQGFGDILVDAEHGRVLVSSGRDGSSIVVFDLDGRVQKTIAGEPGAGAMEIVGPKIYVLLSNGAAIDEFDRATLTETASFPIPAADPPETLAHAGGKLWFGTGECGGGSDLASLDPATGDTVTYPRLVGADYCPGLVASPAAPNILIAWDFGLSPATLYKIDVSGEPAVVAKNRLDASNMRDVAVSPDGATIFTAAGWPYEVGSYRTSDLSKVGVYPTGPYPTAVDISADGSQVAAGVDAAYETDVFVFPASDSTPVFDHDFETSDRTLVPGGLAIGPDDRVYAVTENGSGGALELQVLGTNTRGTTLSLTTSARQVAYRGRVTVTADLAGVRGSGHRVAIYMTPFGESRQLLRSGTAASDGTFEAVVRLERNTTFTAEYAGDASYAPSESRPKSVGVHAKVSYSLLGFHATSGKYKLYHYGDLPATRTSVAPNHSGDLVTFVLQISQDGDWRTLDTATASLEADSTANATVVGGGSPHNYRAKAVFKGGSGNLAGSSRWAYLRYE